MSAQRYSIFSLLRNACTHHRAWQRAWRSPELRKRYEVVIVGAGGHGLATAYYLARDHGVTNVAVLERGWLGGGNTGRNTVTIRSNYLRDPSIEFFEASVKLYEQFTRELNINIMFSQRSQVDIVQTWGKLRDLKRRSYAMALHGPDYTVITPEELRRRIPVMADLSKARLPVLAGVVHKRAAVARHDAIAWGYARQADASGIHIHQNTEVTGIRRAADGSVKGVETTRGTVSAKKVAIAVAGSSTQLAEMAELRLPITTYNLQALVSEPIKPVLNVLVNCPDMGVYLHHSDKGELVIGGGTDPIQSFKQGGRYETFEDVVTALVEVFPVFRRLKLMRQWGGALEFAHDASPIISPTPVRGLFISCGWYGGFKAIPIGGRTFAHTVATGTPHALNAPFTLDRFRALDFLTEGGTVAHR